MSDEEPQYMDWVAAHDQISAEVTEIIQNHRPFIILWVPEEDERLVSSTGLFRPGDEMGFLKALMIRTATNGEGGIPCGSPPE